MVSSPSIDSDGRRTLAEISMQMASRTSSRPVRVTASVVEVSCACSRGLRGGRFALGALERAELELSLKSAGSAPETLSRVQKEFSRDVRQLGLCERRSEQPEPLREV